MLVQAASAAERVMREGTWPPTRPMDPTARPTSAMTLTTWSAGAFVSRAMCSNEYASSASPASSAMSSPYLTWLVGCPLLKLSLSCIGLLSRGSTWSAGTGDCARDQHQLMAAVGYVKAACAGRRQCLGVERHGNNVVDAEGARGKEHTMQGMSS